MTRSKRSAAKQPAAKQPAAKQPAAKQPAAKQPAKQLPAKQLPAKQLPAKQLPAKQLPAKQLPAKQPAKQLPAKPAEQPPAKQPTKQPVNQPATRQLTPKQPPPSLAPEEPRPTTTTKDKPGTFNPLNYMTAEELSQIDEQFALTLKGVDSLLFWTGVERNHVQRWADKWKLKTLSTAMGPLMDLRNPNSPKARKSKKAYSRYIKGASGRFAQFACRHCRVIVLTNPPPDIYSSREDNTYQSLEEPILKGVFGDPPVRRIDYVHPTVDGAAHVLYQVWPCNKANDWVTAFGGKSVKKWKRLNWSYQSIVTTSHLDLGLPQKQTTLLVASMLHVQMPEPSFRPENAVQINSPGVIANGSQTEQTAAGNRDVTRPQQAVDLIEKDHLSPAPIIRGHESQIFAHESRQTKSAISADHLADTQVQDHLDQRHSSPEPELSSDVSPTPAYAVKRCLEPKPPITLPVICIDSIAIGAEVTINVDKAGANEEFLYLTMKTMSGREKWWKMSWI